MTRLHLTYMIKVDFYEPVREHDTDAREALRQLAYHLSNTNPNIIPESISFALEED